MPPPIEGESGFEACLHPENVARPGNLASVMRFGSVDLPEAVLKAHRENRLAIFAGAGVSIPEPTNLPDFEGLVRQIGRGEIQAPGEPFEQFLGRLVEKGISVHRRASEILSRPDSESNVLHRDLVGLFREAETLRIVTTNFDRHLEYEIAKRWPPGRGDIYEAPALPVGSRFSGLVYLHGQLGQFPDRLVLTDKDYGRAYLTEGWARRFVTALYSEYVVLFVGYSYDDAPLRYLVRGLPAGYGPGRFALTKIGDPQRWRYLGIEPIEYDPVDDHREVQSFFNKWVVLHQRGALAHETRLREILACAPSEMLGDDESELTYCLQRAELEPLFFRYANGLEWLAWAHDKGLLARLFDPGTVDEGLRDQAWWFAKGALQPRGDLALEIAWTKHRTISRLLAETIAHAIGIHFANENDRSEEAGIRAANWLRLILQRCDLSVAQGLLGLGLPFLAPETQSDLAAWWFLRLLPPSLEPDVTLFGEPSIPAQVRVSPYNNDAHELEHAWGTLFRPHLNQFAPKMLFGLTAILAGAYQELAAGGALRSGWDPLAFERASIADHEQNKFHDADKLQVVLIAARDSFDWHLEHRPNVAAATVEIWLDSEATLLRRLGLYGLTKLAEPPARKIQRIIDSNWLASFPLKPEVFALLKTCYPKLKSSTRKKFLKAAKSSLCNRLLDRDEERKRSEVYSLYNLLIWLQGADPDCKLVLDELSEIAKSYPEFQPRTHPDLDIVHGEGGVVQAISPIERDKLVALSPTEWLEAYDRVVQEPRKHNLLVDELEGFCEETGRAAAEDFSWGLDLAKAIQEWGFWGHPIWRFLLSSWSERSFDQNEWPNLMSILDREPLLQAQPNEIINFLERWTRREGNVPPEVQWLKFLELGDRLWEICRSGPPGISIQHTDWMQVAINNPAGKLAEFIVAAVSGLQKLTPEIKRIPPPAQALVNKMCNTRGMPELLAVCLLTSRLHYFLWLDSEWAQERLLPCFDWHNTQRAVLAWHGLLNSRVRPDQAPVLANLIENAAPHLTDFGKRRDRFSQMVAWVAYFSPENPLDATWFRTYLDSSNDHDRRELAREVEHILEQLEDGGREAFWRSWLARYFRDRFLDAPPLEGEERAALAMWALQLLPRLAELVEIVKGQPSPECEHGSFFLRLERSLSADLDSNAVTQYLHWVLTGVTPGSWGWREIRSIIEWCITRGADRTFLEKLLDLYTEKLFPGGGELLSVLEARDPSG